MISYLVVFLGAGIGGALRHAVNQIASAIFGIEFPAGTLMVNVIGCFLMGAMISYFGLRGETSQSTRLFFTTGILGGFTTFSAFTLETVLLYQRGVPVSAAIYLIGSVVLSITALLMGMWALRIVL